MRRTRRYPNSYKFLNLLHRDEFTSRCVAAQLGVSQRTAQRYLRDALEVGFIVREDGKYRWRAQ